MNDKMTQDDLELGLRGYDSKEESTSNLLGLALRQLILKKRGEHLEAKQFYDAKPTVWSDPEKFINIELLDEDVINSMENENRIKAQSALDLASVISNIGDFAFESMSGLLQKFSEAIGPAVTPKLLSAASSEHEPTVRLHLSDGVILSSDDDFETLIFSCGPTSPDRDDEDRYTGMRFVIELKGIGYFITKKFTFSGVIQMKQKTLFEKGFLSRHLAQQEKSEVNKSENIFSESLRGRADSTELIFYPPMGQEQVNSILSAIQWNNPEQLQQFFAELDRSE